MTKNLFFIAENGNFILKSEIIALRTEKHQFFIILRCGKEFLISKNDFLELQVILTEEKMKK